MTAGGLVTAAALSAPWCTITDAALTQVRDSQGRFFAPLMSLDPLKIAADALDPRRAEEMAAVLEKYVPLRGKKVLEIGAGCGVPHIVWTKKFGIDGWGVEPEGEGFDQSAAIARELIAANGLDPTRIVNARGEALPFPDTTFDIVYSTNVLEHVDDPAQVLREAVRVLKPGGTVQIVCPNYLSYFDGHYAALHPPIFSNRFFQAWMKWIYRKDPAFAATIRTEVNPLWARRQLAEMPVEIVTLGQEKFIERMTREQVSSWAAMDVVGRLVRLGRRLHINSFAARIMVATQAWTPLIITARRREAP